MACSNPSRTSGQVEEVLGGIARHSTQAFEWAEGRDPGRDPGRKSTESLTGLSIGYLGTLRPVLCYLGILKPVFHDHNDQEDARATRSIRYQEILVSLPFQTPHLGPDDLPLPDEGRVIVLVGGEEHLDAILIQEC